ncbi:hypothetical protein [Tolypothrix sp. FACHB-123]|uniref:hypothetical protein n=1 Tax=Tolypothrix sp. FACHB-123 TaxID=2692868 RepID=UPI001682BEA1|nr:hypothetical protein [Tolypothrix sp. FACHB-123]
MPNAQCPIPWWLSVAEAMPHALFPILKLHPQILARLVIYYRLNLVWNITR